MIRKGLGMLAGGAGNRVGVERARHRPASNRFRCLIPLITGCLAGSAMTLMGTGQGLPASVDGWLGLSAKTEDRLIVAADAEARADLATTCTALVLDRFTGLTAALACSEPPMPEHPLAPRHGEIES